MKKLICFGVCIVLTLVLILAFIMACSSPTTTSPSPSRNPAVTTSLTPTSSLATMPIESVLPTDTMFSYFVSNGNLTIFATALYNTGLIGELRGKGPYTAFVPTDEAYAKMPPLQKENLLKDTAKLKEVVLYGFVQGEYPASKLTPLSTLKTLQGEDLKIGVDQTGVTINDAKFVLADVEANDGVFHIIDKVLIPPSMTLP